MLVFQKKWYNNLISNSNEKVLLAKKILNLIQNNSHKKLLEIGMGTTPFFANILKSYFDEYCIIEKLPLTTKLPENVRYIQADFENYLLKNTFDIVLVSHVSYYFTDLNCAIKKVINLLSDNGRAFFVVNGIDNDYVLVKEAFAKFINKPHTFMYDILKKLSFL